MSYLRVSNYLIPILTVDQMKQVDLIAVKEFGIQII